VTCDPAKSSRVRLRVSAEPFLTSCPCAARKSSTLPVCPNQPSLSAMRWRLSQPAQRATTTPLSYASRLAVFMHLVSQTLQVKTNARSCLGETLRLEPPLASTLADAAPSSVVESSWSWEGSSDEAVLDCHLSPAVAGGGDESPAETMSVQGIYRVVFPGFVAAEQRLGKKYCIPDPNEPKENLPLESRKQERRRRGDHLGRRGRASRQLRRRGGAAAAAAGGRRPWTEEQRGVGL
jgi:hypothetical protein